MEKLLIVDDEEWIVEGLKMQLPWEEMGIQLTRTAASGLEALEILKEEEPSIVLTDIRMPDMDGLNLAKHIYERGLACETIIISGYADFDYARQAIAYGVSAYLMKPVIREELKKAVQESLVRIQGNRARRYQLEQLWEAEKNLELTQYYLQENQRTDDLTEDKEYLTAVFGVTRLEHKDESQEQEADRFLRLAREIPWSDNQCIFFNNRFNPNQYILIVDMGKSYGHQAVYNQLNRYFRMLQKRVSCEMELEGIIGVSEPYHNVNQTFKAYLQAKFVAENLEGSIECRIVTAKEFDSIYSDVKVNHEEIQKLLIAVEAGDWKQVERLYGDFEQGWVHDSNGLIHMRMSIQEMIISLSKLLKRYGCSMYELGCEYADIFRQIWQIDSCDKLREFSIILIEAAMERIEAVKYQGKESIIRKIQKYVDEHYMEPLNQNEIAKRFYINTAYFSRAFKKEMKVNFTDYVKKLRLEQAAVFLLSTNMKVQEIANRVGYDNPNYFIKKFQEMYEVSPKKYREQHKRSD